MFLILLNPLKPLLLYFFQIQLVMVYRIFLTNYIHYQKFVENPILIKYFNLANSIPFIPIYFFWCSQKDQIYFLMVVEFIIIYST